MITKGERPMCCEVRGCINSGKCFVGMNGKSAENTNHFILSAANSFTNVAQSAAR